MDPLEPTLSTESLQRQREEIRRGLARANLAAAVILTVLAGLVGLGVVAASRAERNALAALAATRQGQEELWKSYLARARAERLTGLPGRGEKALQAVAAAAKIRPSLELRNEAIAALAIVDVQAEAVFWPYPAGQLAHGFDAAVKRLAWHEAHGVTRVHDLTDNRELARLAGPDASVRSWNFSPEGRFLAVAYANGEIIVWDLDKKERALLTRYDDRHGRGAGLAFSGGARELAVGDVGANVIRVYEVAGGAEIRRVEAPFPEHVLLHPVEPVLATVAANGREVRVRNWRTGAVVADYTNEALISSFAWAAGPGLLAAGDHNGEITIWDQKSGEKRTLTGHLALVSRLSFSPDGTLLTSSSWDGFSRLWNASSGRLLMTLQGGMAEAFSVAGERLAFEREGAGCGYWPVRHSAIFRGLRSQAGSRKTVFSASFSPDGKFLATTGNDGVHIINAATGTEAAMLPLSGGNLWGQTAAFRPDGESVIAPALNGIHIWPIDSGGNEMAKGTPRLIPVKQGEPTTMKLSQDGRHLVAAVNTRLALLLDLERPEAALEFAHPGVNSVAISPDERWIATGATHGGGHRVWDRAGGKLARQLDEVAGTVEFSPDGRWLVTGGTEEFVIWNTGSWTRARGLPRGAANERSAYCAFSPDSSLLAVVHSQGVIQLFDPRDGAALASLTAPDPLGVNQLSFSADGGSLAVAASPSAVQVWNLRAMREHLGRLGLDYGQPVQATAPLLAAAGVLSPGGYGQLVAVTMTVGGLAFGFACLVFRRHRQLVRAYAEVESRSEQRGQELELARSEIMHGQKMQALGTLAAGIAHDFNNLLSVIRMSNDLNAEAINPAERQANRAEIDSAVQQGKSVVRSMLGYSRTITGEGPYSVSEAVQTSLGLLSRQFLSGMTLKLDLDPDAPKVTVDRGRLEQILLNLVVNASEAMERGGELRVTVRRAAPGGAWNVLRPASALEYVELVATDSGPGIAGDLLPRLFEPFFTTKVAGAARGTGLGLSIVYTIASKDGLGIGANSTPGQGAEFRIAIPAVGAECTLETGARAPESRG